MKRSLLIFLFCLIVLASHFATKYHVQFYGDNTTQNFGIVSDFGGLELIGDFGFFNCNDG